MQDGSNDNRGAGGRKPVKALGLILGFLVLAALCAEVGIRMFWPVGQTILQPDGERLFTTIPNSAHIQFMSERVGGERVIVRVEGNGFRGPGPDEPRTRPRWMVFGDSFVMGENVSYESTFGARLAERWGGEVEVLSSGVTGYGPDQTLLRMEEQIPMFQPDGVVLVLCSYNDLGDMMRNHLVALDGDGELERRTATASPDEVAWFESHMEVASQPGLMRLWKTHQRLKNLGLPPKPDATLIADYLRAAREDYRAHVELGETVAHGLLRDIYDADVAIYPDWPSSQYKVRLLPIVLEAFRDLCEAHEVELVCVVVPGGVDMDPNSWLNFDPKRYPTHRRDRLSQVFAEASESVGITTLNLFPHFEPVRERGLYVGALDIHWNAAGMDLGAEVCVQFLAERKLGPLVEK
ncbi:MAG: SGNH/GDSL hydrolase family protein [Planctomycetota bacterium]|nr:SGNH/GDSL hydrolase family protein [Planctomycetota bacterium]